MFVVKLETPGWLLHSDSAACLAVFPLPPSLSSPPFHCCDGLCLLERHSNLGVATCNQKLKQGSDTGGHYQEGGLDLLLKSKLLSEWTNLISWMFLLSSYYVTGCVTQKEPTGHQEVLAHIEKVLGCLFDILVMMGWL